MTPVRKWMAAALGTVALATSPLLQAQQGSSNTLLVGVIDRKSVVGGNSVYIGGGRII